MARQNTAANANKPGPATPYGLGATGIPQALPPSMPPQQLQQPTSHTLAQPPTYPTPSHGSSMPFSLPPIPGQGPQPLASANNPYVAPAPPPASGGVGLDTVTQQQIVLIKALADQGIPFDKIPALIQSMSGATGATPPTAFQPPVPAAQGSYPTGQQPWGTENARDRGFQDGNRSPNRYRGRSRSRSPERGWGARGSPRGGHDRLEYSHHDERERNNGRRGNGFRQRSPPGRRGHSSTPSSDLPKVDRWIEFDPSLPPGHIKVLSRTLFVGGVT